MEKIIQCPPVRIVKSVDFNEERAKFAVSTGLSAEAYLDWVLTTLYDHPEYTLLRSDGSRFDPLSSDPEVLNLLDSLFGSDPKRGLNRYKERANGGFQNRLCDKLVPSVMVAYFAEQILLRELSDEANRD